MAIFDPFLSLDCARVEGVGAQSKERKGSNFAIWQPWAQAAYPLVLQCVHERMLEDEDPARFSFSLTTVGQVREVAWGLLLLLREPLRLLELIKVGRTK